MFTAKMLVNTNDMLAYKPEVGWGVQKQKNGGAKKKKRLSVRNCYQLLTR